MNDQVLTVTQVAKLMHLSEQTVRAACRRGELPAVHVGRRWLFSSAKLKTLLEGEGTPHVA